MPIKAVFIITENGTGLPREGVFPRLNDFLFGYVSSITGSDHAV